MARIVLVEDDALVRQAVGAACLGQGLAVGLAENCCEAVRLLLEEPATAILVDAGQLRLPLAEQVRVFEAAAPGVPVLVLAEAGVGRAERARYEGAGLEVVRKPVRPDLLAARLGALRGEHRPLPTARRNSEVDGS
jgi:DNA-binding response OmpR family regulator